MVSSSQASKSGPPHGQEGQEKKRARSWYAIGQQHNGGAPGGGRGGHRGGRGTAADGAANLNSCNSPTSSALSTFLHDDIRPEGHRLLLPYLTTMDLLRLSESSKGLIGYRYHLSQVKIVPHPSPSPRMKKGLLRLLADQEGKAGLERLCLHDNDVLHVLELADWGCFQGLKALDLSGVDPSVMRSGLVKALMGGGLKDLEELDLSDTMIGDPGLEMIMTAIGKGACPHLRRLSLQQCGLRETGALARAMETGHLQALQVLELFENNLGSELHEYGTFALLTALEKIKCPDLRLLDLASCGLDDTTIHALGRGLASGMCPQLEEVRLWGNGTEWLLPTILMVMESGGCPNLQALYLRHRELDAEESEAVYRAVASGNCSRLQSLDISWGSGSVGPVLRALRNEAVVFPCLTKLHLSYTAVPEMDYDVLGQALSRGAFPALEELELADILDVDVTGIMQALRGGACPMLRMLDLVSLELSSEEGMEVALALRSGFLKHLATFHIGYNATIGDKAMMAIMEALGEPGAFLKLTELQVTSTGMGFCAGEALLRALNRGVWPNLETLNMSDDRLHEDFIPWLCMVLTKKGLPTTRLKTLELHCPGHDAVMELCQAFRAGACPALESLSVELPSLGKDIPRWIVLEELQSSCPSGVEVEMYVEYDPE